jgi:adenylosuccinate lyase
MVQKQAMRAWEEQTEFLDLLRNDSEIRTHLSVEDINEIFDVEGQLKYVDTIFDRAFGADEQ